eukprot:scaffold192221_cov19-Tisochrysis_lutea.AAC.1
MTSRGMTSAGSVHATPCGQGRALCYADGQSRKGSECPCYPIWAEESPAMLNCVLAKTERKIRSCNMTGGRFAASLAQVLDSHNAR